MEKIKNRVLPQKNSKPIVYDVFFTKTKTPKPIVIFCHGYKGFKDWGAWDLVAEAFAKAGFFFLKFNFSHNGGTVNQPIDFPDLEAFATNNFTKELNDLNTVLEFLTHKNEFSQEIEKEKINLIGHSRGGGIVLIKAQEDIRIKKVVTFAGVSDFRVRFQENTPQFKDWKKTGVLYIENSRTKQQMPHYFQFFEDFIKNESRLTIKRAVTMLNKPYLIIHGSKDPTVLLDEAKQLHQWSKTQNLIIIKEADHVFGAKHPWDKKTMPKHLKEATNKTIEFLT